MRKIDLPFIRYATFFETLVLVDMISVVTLWIIGAYVQYQTSELDQIIRFEFTESIFDIVIIATIKAAIIFISISELEEFTTRIALYSSSSSSLNNGANRNSLGTGQEVLIENAAEEEEEQNNGGDEIEVAINYAEGGESFLSRGRANLGFYRKCKKLLHPFVLIFSLVAAIYVSVKFGYVLKLIVTSRANETSAPMTMFFFAILATEMAFSLVEFLVSTLTWTFMRRIRQFVLREKALREKEASGTSSSGENDEKKKKVNLRRLIGLAHPERHLIMIAFVMLLISSSTNIIVPYFFGAVVDAALKFTDLSEMYSYIGYMTLVFVIGSIAGGIRSWLSELAGQRVVARLRKSILKAIIKQDIKFFDTNRTGELTSRISSDTQVLQSAITSNLSMLVRYALQIAGSVIFMFSLQASLTGLLIGVIPVVTLLTVHYGRYLGRMRKKFQDELAASNVISEESISSMRTIRSFGAEKKISDLYEENITKSFNIGKKLAVAQGGFMGFVGFLSAGALALILWYGGKLVHDKKITTGILASFLMYTLQVAMAFAFLSALYGDFMQALGASQRIFEILDTEPTINLTSGLRPRNEGNDAEEERTFDGSLELDDVSFTYPTRTDTPVLKGISFKVEKGKTLALVGPSGGGKSTIFALIERFYDPDSGSVKIGPKRLDLKSLNLNWWHSKVALVSQEPVLFGGTIKENISFSLEDSNVNMDRIIEAAKLANAHDFIITFEKGYDTVVGERGIRLSGGQKQRIAIARALIVNPKLLLLDEATSALDSESEHLVQEAIDRAMKGRTVCVIAHRLSTVKDADKVIVLDQGQLVEQGTHQELCDMDGIYKRLVLRQLLSNESLKDA